MNHHRRLISGLVALTAVWAMPAQAADALKIGYVDIKSAMENTRQYQEGIKRLEALKARKEKELKALAERIDKAEKELLGQSMAMSPERLSEKQQQIKDMRKELQRKQQDAQEELVAENNRLTMSLGTKFDKIIKDYGKKNHFDLILPKRQLLYANPKFDITADITEQLDRQK